MPATKGGKTWGAAVAAVVAIALSLFAAPAFALEINGFDYGVSGDVLSVYNISNYSYDDYGRVTSFSYSAPDGAHGAGSIAYSDEVKDENDELVSSTGTIHGIDAVEGQSGTVTKISDGASTSGPADGGQGHLGEAGQTMVQNLATAQEEQWLLQKAKRAQEVVNKQALRDQRRGIERIVYGRAAKAFAARARAGLDGDQVAAAEAPLSGMAAGDGPSRWSVWADGALTTFGSSKSGVQNSGTDYLAMLGLEFMATDRVMLGAGLGYGHTDINYHLAAGAKQHDDAFIINPYLAFKLHEYLMLAVQGGLTFGNSRYSGIGLGSTNTDFVTSSVGASLIPSYACDRWVFSGRFGYNYSYKDFGSGSYEDVRQGLLGAGAGVAYQFDMWSPYIDIMYSYDTFGKSYYQNDDVVGTIGLAVYPTDNFQVDFSVANTFFRTDEYNTTFDLNLRYTF